MKNRIQNLKEMNKIKLKLKKTKTNDEYNKLYKGKID